MAPVGPHPCDRVDAGEHPLKAWREYLGWDHQRLRVATGIRVEVLDRMERGIIRLSRADAAKIGRAMGVAAINLMPFAGGTCSDLDVDED
jgi:hypothetical protein